jgi:hypothetical protein
MGDYSKMGPNEQKTYNNCEHKNISMVIDGVLLRVDTYYKNLVTEFVKIVVAFRFSSAYETANTPRKTAITNASIISGTIPFQ